MISFPFTSKRNHQHFYKKYGQNFFRAIIKYVFYGFYANNIEYGFYIKHKNDLRIVPTIKRFARGFVVLQPRGSNIASLEFKDPFEGICNPSEEQDIHDHWQFCRLDNRTLLADYGRKETCIFLIKNRFTG
jgi:hypothetical protein